jgi:hypothetical protein
LFGKFVGTMDREGRHVGDVFYETRVLMGRDFTLRRFADEVLGGAVDPVMLGYIEKGQRFPSESLVRRLASVRKESPRGLLALLWRDRIVHAFAKELRRVLHAPHDLDGVDDAELAIVVSRAIAALPDDESWIPVARWRRAMARNPDRRSKEPPASPERVAEAEEILTERGLVELARGRVRRQGRHWVAQGPKEQWALALQFVGLFAQGLLDKLALPEVDTGTYMRNHYLNIEAARLPEFRQRLDASLRALAEEFAADPSSKTRFVDVLVTATPRGKR